MRAMRAPNCRGYIKARRDVEVVVEFTSLLCTTNSGQVCQWIHYVTHPPRNREVLLRGGERINPSLSTFPTKDSEIKTLDCIELAITLYTVRPQNPMSTLWALGSELV
jgi:hypothetical protein